MNGDGISLTSPGTREGVQGLDHVLIYIGGIIPFEHTFGYPNTSRTACKPPFPLLRLAIGCRLQRGMDLGERREGRTTRPVCGRV